MALALLLVLLPQVTVRTSDELRQVARQAKPGDRIYLAPGDYEGGVYLERLRGKERRPIVIAAADPEKPPIFKGGGNGIQLAEAAHVELRDLIVEGSTANGVSVDDGGRRDGSSRGVLLSNVAVRSIGPDGNRDGIKLSGLDGFRVENCIVERWGTGGSGIDMVGCHDGVIEGCTFRHDGQGGNGVQMKGGCERIVVRRCRFDDTGARGVNIGGSTGLEYFRPPLQDPPHAEAREITVEGCTFTGTDAPIAFVGVDGARVRFNTIYVPRRWAIRILQETTAEGFVPCRNGEFTDNIVVFQSARWREGGVNIGPGTDAASFTFARNRWFCADAPARSRPTIPSAEKDGVYGEDPRLRDPEKGDLRLRPDSPAKSAGPDALR